MGDMKTLEKSKDKIEKICAVIREETLEPAQKQAEEIIQQATRKAEQITAEAQKNAEKLHANAKTAITQEYNVFQASLSQAAKQSLEALRQEIENNFFSQHLSAVIEKNAADPQIIANLIDAIVECLRKEGLAANLTALIPKKIAPKQINALLLQETIQVLKEHSVSVGNFSGGAQIRLNNKKMTIDISDGAIKELLAGYVVRKDFRKMIFEQS